MIWNYVKTAGLISPRINLHIVFRNLIALVTISGKTNETNENFRCLISLSTGHVIIFKQNFYSTKAIIRNSKVFPE